MMKRNKRFRKVKISKDINTIDDAYFSFLLVLFVGSGLLNGLSIFLNKLELQIVFILMFLVSIVCLYLLFKPEAVYEEIKELEK